MCSRHACMAARVVTSRVASFDTSSEMVSWFSIKILPSCRDRRTIVGHSPRAVNRHTHPVPGLPFGLRICFGFRNFRRFQDPMQANVKFAYELKGEQDDDKTLSGTKI